MLTCITCSKQKDDDDDGSRGTPSSKDSVKSLTSQLKGVLRLTTGGGHKTTPVHGASSSSTPALTHPITASRPDASVYGYGSSMGSQTPGGRSTQSYDVVLDDETEPKEWVAQVEPGVHITFVSLPGGGNDLKRIRFNREMFDKWEAQRWWGENYDRIMELYNVQRFNQQAIQTPARSEDDRESSFSRPVCPIRESPVMTAGRSHNRPYGGGGGGGYSAYGSMESSAARATTSSRDDVVSLSNASEVEAEWIEEDEPGVCLTIRQLVDGSKELRRVRFSRERFGEVHAKLWWERNRQRIEAQYLS